MTKVFISYVHENIDLARKLFMQLKTIPNIEPWLDKECISPGLRWRPAIRKEIRESRFFIALISKRCATKRGFFQTEMKEALDILSEFPEDQIFIIPVRLENCDIPS
ncbi:MAG: toll/interleukin-1 receptor domain-containing protein [Dehalococcoidales bacterium]|nr:toll/interleukin-1 receptor domain-containing protein [Dehalococcoidales bacterium]